MCLSGMGHRRACRIAIRWSGPNEASCHLHAQTPRRLGVPLNSVVGRHSDNHRYVSTTHNSPPYGPVAGLVF